MLLFFFFKQKTAYEMRISDWSSDVCSSDLIRQLLLAEAERLAIDPGERLDAQGRPLAADDAKIDALLEREVRDRKSVVSGKSVSVRVDLGGRRIIKK